MSFEQEYTFARQTRARVGVFVQSFGHTLVVFYYCMLQCSKSMFMLSEYCLTLLLSPAIIFVLFVV